MFKYLMTAVLSVLGGADLQTSRINTVYKENLSNTPKYLAPLFNQQKPPETTNVEPRYYNPQFHPAVIQVRSMLGWSGTAFFIRHNQQTVLVTASHVCGNQNVLVSAYGIHKVILSVPERDVCILTTYQNVAATVELGDDPEWRQEISTTGFPMGLMWDQRMGITKSLSLAEFVQPTGAYGPIKVPSNIFGYTSPLVQSLSSCPEYAFGLTNLETGDNACLVVATTIGVGMLVRPGNSGGPAFDMSGRVVGIVIATDGKGTGFIVPVSELKGVLKDVKLN